MAVRLQAMGQSAYINGFALTLHPEKLEQPLEWRKPSTIFVNSMSDLFHEDIPSEFIMRVFATMEKASWHRFQILTKRAERLAELSPSIPWPDNVWMGVTVERKDYIHRIDYLRKTGAHVKFLSCEPLLGPLPQLDLEGVGWLIVGGESGPSSRRIDPAWVTGLRDQCLAAQVPFFFKQWGGRNKRKAGRELDGRQWSQMPAASRLCPQSALPI